jgi:hypothetical protein
MGTSAPPHTIDRIYFPLLYGYLSQQYLQFVCPVAPFRHDERVSKLEACPHLDNGYSCSVSLDPKLYLECLEKWPIYYREAVAAPKDITAGDFGTITREDGKMQTTFRGYPLYYWVNDKQAGETNGQGVNNVWFVINPKDFPPKQ